jgi:protein tyrosine/serine phosphatase
MMMRSSSSSSTATDMARQINHLSVSSLRAFSETSSSSSSSSIHTEPSSTSSSSSNSDADAASFKQRTKQLCEERNLSLEKVKNARDLASVSNSPVKPGRLFRMGRISDATNSDIELLLNTLQLQTIVDLRSPTELKDDSSLLRKQVFEPFVNMVWKEPSNNNNGKSKRKDGCVRELAVGEFPVKKPFWSKQKFAGEAAAAEVEDSEGDSETMQMQMDVDDDDEDELCDLDCADPKATPASQLAYKNRKERHFVSLMNEMKYVKGTVSRVRKRDITKAILKSPGALVSKRVRTSVKEPFLLKINEGGLPMLNELLLRYGAPGIKYVLELCADRQRHPVAFYCTAGKDRTGMIAAIILGLCGVKIEDIVEDYSLSANVYAEMNDHQAMVGALSQRNLDAKTFLGAPPYVMKDTLLAINNEYGSLEGYCNWIGFGPEQQEKLRKACMEE